MSAPRKSGRWQCALDERILEFLRLKGWSSPELIARELSAEASRRRVHERCRVLAHAGLVLPNSDDVDADRFNITGWGELYLDGKINAELMRPLPRPRPPDKVRPIRWMGPV